MKYYNPQEIIARSGGVGHQRYLATDRVLSFSPVIGIGLPHPLTRRRMCSPLLWWGGGGEGTHSLAGERVGWAQFRRGDRHCCALGIYVLCGGGSHRSAPIESVALSKQRLPVMISKFPAT
jgi:hypothetical protein